MPFELSKRIFIAEDDPAILELVKTRLEIAGYSTAYARDGHQALEGIRRTLPDGIILDIGMPRMDGFDVLTALKTFPTCKSIPVLVLTARHAAEDVRKAISLGARDYLSKPFDDAQLLSRVARMLRQRVTRDIQRPAASRQA